MRSDANRSHVRGTHDASDSARARVRRGIKALNAYFSGGRWRKRVATNRLDIRNSDTCVLGQLFGSFAAAPDYVKLADDAEWAGANGFNAMSAADAARLVRAWRSELRAR